MYIFIYQREESLASRRRDRNFDFFPCSPPGNCVNYSNSLISYKKYIFLYSLSALPPQLSLCASFQHPKKIIFFWVVGSGTAFH